MTEQEERNDRIDRWRQDAYYALFNTRYLDDSLTQAIFDASGVEVCEEAAMTLRNFTCAIDYAREYLRVLGRTSKMGGRIQSYDLEPESEVEEDYDATYKHCVVLCERTAKLVAEVAMTLEHTPTRIRNRRARKQIGRVEIVNRFLCIILSELKGGADTKEEYRKLIKEDSDTNKSLWEEYENE